MSGAVSKAETLLIALISVKIMGKADQKISKFVDACTRAKRNVSASFEAAHTTKLLNNNY